jgi:hypothetical protein
VLTKNNIYIRILHNRLLSPITYYAVGPMLHKMKDVNDPIAELYRGAISRPLSFCDQDMLSGYMDSM